MKNITVGNLVSFTGGSLLGNLTDEEKEAIYETKVQDIAIDSRVAGEGDLFVAIIGERNDAHKYIPQTMKKASCVLMSRNMEEMEALLKEPFTIEPGKAYIYVPDTVQALQKIGAGIRELYTSPVIGVTGSVGKTTTREMIWTALAANVPTFKTLKNLNSQIGLPITTSHIMDEDTEAAVLEMGISMPGEMEHLAEVAKPDIAVVTMIGVSHIEFLKTQRGIRDEKLKIASLMNEKGIVLLNGDDPLLSEVSGEAFTGTVYFYGTGSSNDFIAEDLRIENGMQAFDYVHGDVRVPVRISVLGQHNVRNALAGMAVADLLGLDLLKAAKGFESFRGLRQLVLKAENGAVLIDDSYNASPDSMKASLDVLSNLPVQGKKIAVLGDMFELGPDERRYHREVGEFFSGIQVDHLITIGSLSKEIEAACLETDSKVICHHAESLEEGQKMIEELLSTEDAILFKASNGMHFSELVSYFREKSEA